MKEDPNPTTFLIKGQIKKAMDSKFNRDPFVGYTYEEISDFFQDKIHMFPKAYLEFLQLMERKSFFLNGLTYSLYELHDIRRNAELLLAKNNPPLSITEDDFVFCINEGYLFVFFNLKEGNNPPIYGFAEAVNQEKMETISPSLSQFLERILIGDEELFDPMYTNSTFPSHVYRREKRARQNCS